MYHLEEGAHLRRMTADRVQGRAAGRGDQRPARPGYGRLLARNGFERVAQICAVIQGDVGDNREHGIEHIGRIQPAAQTDFEDAVVHIVPPEEFRRQHHAPLEIGQPQPAE